MVWVWEIMVFRIRCQMWARKTELIHCISASDLSSIPAQWGPVCPSEPDRDLTNGALGKGNYCYATVTLIQCQVASKCMISVGQFQVSIPKIDILFEKLIISQYSTIFAVNASRIPRFMVCCDIVQRILVWIMNIDWFSQFSVYEKF